LELVTTQHGTNCKSPPELTNLDWVVDGLEIVVLLLILGLLVKGTPEYIQLVPLLVEIIYSSSFFV
jgi:hypothetical protein